MKTVVPGKQGKLGVEGWLGREGDRMEKLQQDKMAATEQAEALKENLSEFKGKAEAKFTQNHNTVQALQARLEGMERQVAERDEDLRRLEQASGDRQSISKSEMDQALSEKEQKMSVLGAELERCSLTLSEREEQLAARTRECEQLTADLRQRRSLWEAERKEIGRASCRERVSSPV